MSCLSLKDFLYVIFVLMIILQATTGLKPHISSKPRNTDCSLGSRNCHLDCVAIPSVGVTIQWSKDGTIVVGNSRIIITAGEVNDKFASQLKLSEIQRGDKGEYRCIAKNVDGSVTSDPASLNIFGPPSVNVGNPLPQSISVKWHEPFYLQCDGEGTPSIQTISWTYKAFVKGIDALSEVWAPGELRRRLNDPALRVLPREDDAMRMGVVKYEVFCTVTNMRGSQRSKTTVINIKQKPGTPIINRTISLDLGTAVTLLWRPGSTPSDSTACNAIFKGKHPLTKRLRIPVKPGVNKETIAGLHPSTKYTVTIQCSNSVDTSDSSEPHTFVTRVGVPEVVSNVLLKALNSTSFRVSWTPLASSHLHESLNGYKVTWKANRGVEQVSKTASDVNELILGGLKPGETYSASVLGFTLTKEGPSSDMKSVTLPLFDNVVAPSVNVSKVFSKWATFFIQDKNSRSGALTDCSLYLSNDNTVRKTKINIGIEPSSMDISDLKPDRQYAVKIGCKGHDNRKIDSDTKYFRTLEDVPDAKPRRLSLKEDNSSVIATWAPIDGNLNGNFTGYNACMIASQSHPMICHRTIQPRYIFRNVRSSSVYTIAVSACTKVGCGTPAFAVHRPDGSWTSNTVTTAVTIGVPVNAGHFNLVYVGIAVLAVAIIIVIVAIVTIKKRRKKPVPPNNIQVHFTPEGQYEVPLLQPTWTDTNTYCDIPSLPSPTLTKETLVKLDGVEISCKAVILKEVIGKGEFGRVYKGELSTSSGNSENVVVAVKTMIMQEYEQSEFEEFVKEGLRMKDMDHPNVMRLIGICLPAKSNDSISNSSELKMSGLESLSPLVVVPYMPNGDLKSYLYHARMNNEMNEVGINKLLQFAYDISCGMEYLTAKHIVHRDLACRNCMLDANMTVVVSDFGLSRQIYSSSYYVQKRAAKMPVKWMALESLMDRVYTSMTDVWAFGVTVWELFTYCQNPFPGVENQEMLELLKAGTRLNRPTGCPNDVWNDAIYPCWDPRADERPTFTELAEMFAGFKKLYHHESGSDPSDNRFYVNMYPPDAGEYEKLVSKSRSNTVSSQHNEIPVPYEDAVVRLPSGKYVRRSNRSNKKLLPVRDSDADTDDVVDL